METLKQSHRPGIHFLGKVICEFALPNLKPMFHSYRNQLANLQSKTNQLRIFYVMEILHPNWLTH